MFRDHKGQQESRQAEQESEAKFRKLFESCPHAVFLADAESGIIIDVNLAARELMDMPREDILGLHRSQLHPHEETEEYEIIFREHILKGEASTQDINIQRPSGELVPVDISATLVEISGKRIVQAVFRDISDRKAVEEALRESEQKYRDLVENIDDVIYAVDENGIITYVSPTVDSFSGYNASEVIGRHFSDFIYEKDLQRVRESFLRILCGHRSEVNEYRALTKSGRIRCMRTSSRPMFVEDRVVGVQGMLADITERKQAEQEIKQRNQELAALNAIANTVCRSLDLDEIMNRALDKVLEVMGVEVGTIRLLDAHTGEMVLAAYSGLSDEYVQALKRLRVTEAEILSVVTSGEPVLVQDLCKDPRADPGLREAFEKERLQSLAAVPLQSKDKVLGMLVVTSRETHKFTPRHLELLTSIGSQIGMAIENASLYQEQRRRLSEMEALSQTTLDITQQLEVPQLLSSIVERAAALVGTRGGGLYLYHPEDEELELVVSYYLDKDYTGTLLKVGEGLSGEVARTGEPLIIEDYANWESKSEKYRDAPFSGIMAVPLKWGEKILGVLNVTEVEQPRAFTAHDLWLLELFASQAATAIENARLFAERERRIRQLAALHEVSLDVAATTDMSEVLPTIVRKATQLLDAQAGAIDLFDPESQKLEMKVSYGYSKDYSGIRLGFGEGVVGKVAESKQPVMVDNYAHWDGRVPQIERDEIGPALGVPLMRGDEFLGVLTIDRRVSISRPFDENDVQLATLFANQAAIAIENARLHAETRRRLEELSAIEEIVHELSSTLDFKKVLQLVLNKAIEATNASAGSIAVVDEKGTGLLLLAEKGYPAEVEVYRHQPWSIERGISGRVVRTGELSLVEDVSQDPDYVEVIPETRSQLTVPIIREDKVAGAILLESASLGGFGKEQGEFVQHLAKHAAVAMENARLYEEQQRRSQELMALHETSLHISSRLDLDSLLTAIIARAVNLFDARSGDVYLYRSAADELISAACHNLAPQLEGLIMKTGEGLAGKILETGEPLIVDDYDAWPGRSESYAGYGFGRVMGTPVRYGEEFLGVLVIERPLESPAFTKKDVGLLNLFANQAAIAIENARLYERLRESEGRYRAYVENVPDAVWEADAEGRFTYWSPQIENLTGYAPHELLGHTPFEFLIHPDDVDEFRNTIQQMVEERKEGYVLTHHVLHRDGSVLHSETSMSPVWDDTGQVLKYRGVARDISERVHLQAQLVQSAKLSAIGQMISGVAHELNNPLTTIMGYSQLLQVSDVDEIIKEDLQRIYNDALRAQRIVQNLLIFARQKRPQRTQVDVNEIIERALSLRYYQLRLDNVEVVKELAENLPLAMADDYQLQQVFLNIVNNAHHAMIEENDGGILTVKSELLEGDVIRVSVADTGPGIPPEILDKVFDPFFTTKDVGAGTGLGLSVSHGIVQEHGGRIWAESEPGQGATFFIELPVEGPVEPTTPPSSDKEAESKPSERPRILVIDDERSIVDLIVRVLEDSGYQVEGITNARLALERLHQEQYDLIISDIKMPGMDGPAWEKEVMAIDPALTERIIFITGDLLSPTTQAFLEGSKGRFVRKPFNVEELKALVIEVLG